MVVLNDYIRNKNCLRLYVQKQKIKKIIYFFNFILKPAAYLVALSFPEGVFSIRIAHNLDILTSKSASLSFSTAFKVTSGGFIAIKKSILIKVFSIAALLTFRIAQKRNLSLSKCLKDGIALALKMKDYEDMSAYEEIIIEESNLLIYQKMIVQKIMGANKNDLD